jgi:hypothetical protein
MARYEDIGTLFDEKSCRSEPNPFRSAGDDGGLAPRASWSLPFSVVAELELSNSDLSCSIT